MSNIATPVPANTPLGESLGGFLVGRDQFVDPAGTPAVGEVADSPTPFTMLARLKAIATALAGNLKVGAPDGGALATAAKQDAALALMARPGLGDLGPVPAGAANGVLLGAKPAGTRKVRLYLPAGASMTFTVLANAPGTPPAATFTASASDTGPNWDEEIADGVNVYVTARVGAPLFRYV